jgi:hypothetical protein
MVEKKLARKKRKNLKGRMKQVSICLDIYFIIDGPDLRKALFLNLLSRYANLIAKQLGEDKNFFVIPFKKAFYKSSHDI